jgi:hypothetical protein
MGVRAATEVAVSEHLDFARELIALTKEAVDFYHKMSGDAVPCDEKFIRDWMAIKLYKSQCRQVMFEVSPSEFCSEVLKNRTLAPHIFPSGRIDMIIFGRDFDQNAFSIIELKKDATPNNFDEIRKDIQRTSRLLSECDSAMAGYQLFCVVVGGETKATALSPIGRYLAKIVEQFGNICGKIVSEEYSISGAEKPSWCGVYVVPVKPSTPISAVT